MKVSFFTLIPVASVFHNAVVSLLKVSSKFLFLKMCFSACFVWCFLLTSGLDTGKPVFWVGKQECRPACASAQYDKCF